MTICQKNSHNCFGARFLSCEIKVKGGFVMTKKSGESSPSLKKRLPVEPDVSKILRTLSEEESFYFYKAYGKPIGEKAVSLADFVKKLETIDDLSVAFHFYRGDFERWIKDTIQDPELAAQLSIHGRTTLKGEALRERILNIIRARFNEFKVEPP
jgi:hypothetical protein